MNPLARAICRSRPPLCRANRTSRSGCSTGDPRDRGFYAPPAIPVNAPVYHGTFIAGLIGAVGNNGIGLSGINWSVQIMAIRVIGQDQTKPEEYFTVSRLLAAWEYVIQMKRRGVNIRVTSHSEGLTAYGEAERDAIETVASEGILTIVGAGNDSLNHDMFASFFAIQNMAPVISVANSTASDQLNSGSDFGASTVDLAAPGSNITSTAPGGGYRTASGTSYSCPLVAGAAGLLFAAKPDLTVFQAKAALLGSVDQLPAFRGKLMTAGRLNVARALDVLTNGNLPPIVISALPSGTRTGAQHPLAVIFSHPMDRASVEAAFEITPPLNGAFHWTADNRSVAFEHLPSFDLSKRYTIRIRASAQAETGTSLDGNFNRTTESSPTDDFVWRFGFPVPNDDAIQPQPLTGQSGSVKGNNFHTIYEIGERVPQNFYDPYNIEDLASVWYIWSPPVAQGWFTFDIASAAFDPYLSVYTGGSLHDFALVAENDNFGARSTSRVSFNADANHTYYISVIGKSGLIAGQSGTFTLNWYPTPGPAFGDTAFSPSSASPGTKITLMGTNFTGASEVLFNGARADFANAPTNNIDHRITAIVPSEATSGPITIVTPHGTVISANAFTIIPLTALSVTRSSDHTITLSWPVASSGFVLESTVLPSGENWIRRNETSLQNNENWTLTLPASDSQRFFRLRKP
jgi:hypothetical protein